MATLYALKEEKWGGVLHLVEGELVHLEKRQFERHVFVCLFVVVVIYLSERD